MLHVSRAAAKAFSVALTAASLATARTGVIDMDGNGISDIPIVTRSAQSGCMWASLNPAAFPGFGFACYQASGSPSVNDFFSWGSHVGATPIVIRNEYPNTTSFAWAGGNNWQTIPVAYMNNSTISVQNNIWDGWRSWNGSALKIGGMFNADGNTDILFVKRTDNSASMAFGATVGRFTSSQFQLPAEMAADLRRTGAQWFVGDVSGDKIDDILIIDTLTNMGYVGVATSRGDGNFNYARSNAGSIPRLIGGTTLRHFCFFGDFDGDGRKDLAVLDQRDQSMSPVAFSNGSGGFSVVSAYTERMNYYASLQGARALVGDFDGNGVDDLALAGGKNWGSIPIAFGSKARGFSMTNDDTGIPDVFGDPSGTLVVGDFDGDGKSDVAMVGQRIQSPGMWVIESSRGNGFFKPSWSGATEDFAKSPSAFPLIEQR